MTRNRKELPFWRRLLLEAWVSPVLMILKLILEKRWKAVASQSRLLTLLKTVSERIKFRLRMTTVLLLKSRAILILVHPGGGILLTVFFLSLPAAQSRTTAESSFLVTEA